VTAPARAQYRRAIAAVIAAINRDHVMRRGAAARRGIRA
jgi:hypothetical protein